MNKTDLNISACIITNNDRRVLKAIDSVKNVCNEIIIVETSGRNDFLNELQERNCKVFYYDWDYNFSNARNYSISKATCKWILIIDSDEIMKGEIVRLPETFKCYYAQIMNGELSSYNARLFRNLPEIRYQNAIHETVDYCFTENEKCKSNIKFVHSANYVTLSEIEQKKKILRNYKIMLRDKHHPLRDYYLAYTYSKYPKKKTQAIIHAYNAVNRDIENEHKANIYILLYNLSGKTNTEHLEKSISLVPNQFFARLLIAEHLQETEALKQYQYIINLLYSGKSELANDVKPDIEFLKNKIKSLWQFKQTTLRTKAEIK